MPIKNNPCHPDKSAEGRDLVEKYPIQIYKFALTAGDLALARDAAEETAKIDVAKDPEYFSNELGADAFFKLVSISDVKQATCLTSNITPR
jgi:hypothetical protein